VRKRLASVRKVETALYCALTLFLFVHFLRYNSYSPDTVEFAGNVVALETSDARIIHDVAYGAVTREAPVIVIPHILGTDLATDEAAVRRDKYANPFHFVGFLPYFAVKPLYIEALNLVHTSGVGLVRSIAVVSSISFLGLAVMIYLWVRQRNGSLWVASILLLTPELRGLGEVTGPDALSVLFLLAALFSLFQSKAALGIAFLMSSIWVRPDNVILAILVLAYLTFTRELRLWMGSLLAFIALLTPLVINHFAGSAGWQALYLHTFYTERAPGEFSKVAFTAADYFMALRSGAREILSSTVIPYSLLGVLGYAQVPRMRVWIGLCTAFAIVRFLIYPNYEPRYYGIVFVIIGITACFAVKNPGHWSMTHMEMNQEPVSEDDPELLCIR
jgi:hypothetical protein